MIWQSENCERVQMSFGLFRMCIRGDCVIDITNKRLIRHFAAGGNHVLLTYWLGLLILVTNQFILMISQLVDKQIIFV